MAGTIKVAPDGTQATLVLAGDPGAAPAVSAVSNAVVYMDESTEFIRFSINGSVFRGFAIGSGSPQGVITASPGDFYVDATGGSLYVKATGSGTNTGWASSATASVPVTQLAANTTLSVANYLVAVDASGGPITISLPDPTVVGTGRTFVVKKTDATANAVTVVSVGGGTIDGGASASLSVQFSAFNLTSDDSVPGYWIS